MLFIFESDDYWTFHMKNTFIPLDIAFIKEDGTIDSIKELDPMSPIPVYPDSEIRYAVEVNRGWFAENNVNVGDALLEEAEIITEVKDKKGKGSGTKDACYHKVKSRYSVWPSAYASGALVKCRKVGAANWGNSRKEEYVPEEIKKTKTVLPRTTTELPVVTSTSTTTIPKTDKKEFKQSSKELKSVTTIPKMTTTMIKKEHYSWRDSFDLDEMTIAQRNSKQNQNKIAAQNRAKEMAKSNIQKFGGTASAAAANKQAMVDKAKVKNNPTQGKPMPSNPAGMRQQAVGGQAASGAQRAQTSVRTRGGGVQSAPKKQGLLGRIGSGIKRVAGGVADAATGNRFDFDKRGGQRPPRPAGQAAGGAVAAGSGNVRGSGARQNRAGQSAGGAAGGAVASGGGNVRGSGARQNRGVQARPAGQAAGGAVASRPAGQASGGAVASRPAGQSAGGGASASRKIDGAGLANTMRAQNNQSGGQRRPVSPQMQQKLNRIGSGTRAAQAVQKLNPKPGQTVTTKQNAQGGTTATLTGGTGSVSGNVNKAKRIIKNQNVGPTTMGKIDDF
jgi:hypothetical protein